eukprot:GHVS01075898.1.p1 GENE.GHVS01075898.1~~GHVS01075898.1.p1  ORF type:complete len:248 (+),score=56.78 GHVS01075898.1:30-773(+)
MATQTQSLPVRIYLFIFNGVSFLLWARLIYTLLLNTPFSSSSSSLSSSSPPSSSSSSPSLWHSVQHPLQLAQTIALLEIVHSVTRLVSSPASTVALQLASRLQLVWIVWPLVEDSRRRWMWLCLLMWALAEMCRYPYFALTVMNPLKVPVFLKWLRYSAFLLLYPVGIACEALCMYNSLPSLQTDPWLRRFPQPMPNALNFQLDLYYVYVVVLLLYVPGTVHLYGYMLRQRKKTLTPFSLEEEKKTD